MFSWENNEVAVHYEDDDVCFTYLVSTEQDDEVITLSLIFSPEYGHITVNVVTNLPPYLDTKETPSWMSTWTGLMMIEDACLTAKNSFEAMCRITRQLHPTHPLYNDDWYHHSFEWVTDQVISVAAHRFVDEFH